MGEIDAGDQHVGQPPVIPVPRLPAIQGFPETGIGTNLHPVRVVRKHEQVPTGTIRTRTG